jgi:hypothetical protein
MKPFIKYISLLLFSGLIVPFYNYNSNHLLKLKKLSPASIIVVKKHANGLGFIMDIVKNSFPVLKSLNGV